MVCAIKSLVDLSDLARNDHGAAMLGLVLSQCRQGFVKMNLTAHNLPNSVRYVKNHGAKWIGVAHAQNGRRMYWALVIRRGAGK
jgi:hypothetical protein